MRRHAVWMGGLLVLGACDSAPSAPVPVPATPSLAAAASAAAGNLELAIGTPAMHSLGIVGGRMIIPGTALEAAETPRAAPCGPRRVATTLHAPRTTHLSASLIADSLFGRVYAYDAPSRSYYRTTGAGPSAGVRFLLDALDDYGQPTKPSSPVGWLDLTDESAGGVVRLRARVHDGPAVNADYVLAPTGSQAAYTVPMAGRVAYRSSGFPFSSSIEAAGNTVHLLATVDSAVPGVQMTLGATRVTFDAADFRHDLDLVVRRGAQTIHLAGTNDTYCYFAVWTVAVTVNDTAVATYVRDLNTVTITPAAGRTLSDELERAITDLVVAQQLLFDWLQSLFMPVWRLLPP